MKKFLSQLIMMMFAFSMYSPDTPAQPLDSLILIGLRNNFAIRSYEFKRLAAEERSMRYQFLPAPSVGLEFSDIPIGNFNLLNKSLSNTLSISQMFPLGDKLGFMETAELKNLAVIDHERHSAEVQLTAKIKMAYYAILQLKSKISIYQEQQDIDSTLLRYAAIAVQGGNGSTADIFLLESSIASLDAQIESLVLEIEAEIAALQNIIQSSQPIQITEEQLPIPANTLNGDSLSSVFTEQNPELKAMSGMIAMKEAERAANERELIPDLMVQAMFMRMPQGMVVTTQTSADKLGGGKTDYMYSVMASVTLPFVPWSAGAVTHRSEEILAQIKQTELERDQMKTEMRTELIRSVSKWKIKTASIQTYQEKVLPPLQKAVDLSLKQYENRSVALTQYLEYRKMLTMEKMNLLMAAMDAWMASTEIEMIIGKEL